MKKPWYSSVIRFVLFDLNSQAKILIFYRLKYPGLVLELVNYVVASCSTWVLLQKLFGSWNVSESRRTSYVSLFTNSFLTNYQRSRHFFLEYIYFWCQTKYLPIFNCLLLGVVLKYFKSRKLYDFEDPPKPI